MDTIDFARSFLRFIVDLRAQAPITLSHKPPTTENNVRINVECRCTMTRRGAGKPLVYAMGASCKTERVGAKEGIWIEPNADFCLVASEEEFLIVKSWQKNNMGVKRFPENLGMQPERQVGRVKEAWTAFSIDVRSAPARALATTAQIIEAVRGDRPLVSRTEYDDGDVHVVIEHPVKTINFSRREMVYQTDTGPVILPNFARPMEAGLTAGIFELAYSAFNAPDWAEFVINVPTSLSEGISVNHYSRTRRIQPAANTILELA